SQSEYWYPDVDGNQLVYGTVEYQADGSDDRHVYLVDLSSPAAIPEQLDADGEASMPVLHGRSVIWKTAPREFSSLNWGSLEIKALSDGGASPIPFPEVGQRDLNRPSVGANFLTAET